MTEMTGKSHIIQLVPESPKELTFNIVFLPNDKNGHRHFAVTSHRQNVNCPVLQMTRLQANLNMFTKDDF